jgi:hypothetical protein
MALDRHDFVWRGLALHLGRRKTPVLILIADTDIPHLYRIKYSNGWTSAPANLSRAKDAAHGHARFLLAGQSRAEGDYSRESDEPIGEAA